MEAVTAAHAALRRAHPDIPAALLARQDAALERFASSGFPLPSDEDWRYTNLREFRDAELVPAAPTSADAPDLLVAGLRLIVDPTAITLPDSLPDGLRLTTLRRALAEDDALASQLMSVGGDSAMGQLNDAFASDALIVQVADNANIDTPIVVEWQLDDRPDALSCPRLAMVCGRHSRATVLERRIGRGGLTNAVTTLQLHEGATLTYVDVSEQLVATRSVAAVQAEVGRDASLNAFSLSLGGTLNRVDTHVRLAAPGANVSLKGTFLAASGEHVDHHTAIEHAAGHTHSVEDYRGIIGRAGRGVFNGKVIVGVDAQKITSAQSNDNLLLDDSARIDTKPELQIFADDVACSHGATVGRMDDQALFYLRSRGLDEPAARRLLMDAFGQKPLSALPDPLREPIAQRLNDAFHALTEDTA